MTLQPVVDPRIFERTVKVSAIRIPCSTVGAVMRNLKVNQFIWAAKGKKSVYPCPSDPAKFRILLLNEGFPVDFFVQELGGTITDYSVSFGYGDVNMEQALEVLLPGMEDRPTSFETIGHIAHMNLRDEYLPYKQIIGEVVLDKNAHIDVVVNKVGTLEGEFRTFNMEVIASREKSGLSPSLVTTVSENKMKILIDFEHVYWNSRLSTERTRLLKQFASTDISSSRYIDMCCGVGALACFAAREGLEVYANDLNPTAVDCVRQNALNNHVDVHAYNMDAREFVRMLAREGKLFYGKKTNHFMINLPEIGIDFLDVFNGLLNEAESSADTDFRVYCHCFSKFSPADEDIHARLGMAIGDPAFPMENVRIVHVRDVAPKKIMYSVEFTVPKYILQGHPPEGHLSKRVRVDDS